VDSRHSEPRHIVERRLLPDRRRGLQRRIDERRLSAVDVLVNRRGAVDRRARTERRSAQPRRSRIDRPRSGRSFPDLILD